MKSPHPVSPKPLAGLRVIEMDGIGPVPLAGMLLSDLGADVLRIARPPGNSAWQDIGGSVLHRGRPCVHLDLKIPADQQAALATIARADGLIEGFRPGVMERLGLGPLPCLATNPRLVYVRLTGWGQSGPLSLRAGHDINYISLTGVLEAIGPANQPPAVPLNMIGDYAGGTMFALLGLLAALFAARESGKGQVIDVAMTDGVAALSAMFHAFRASGFWKAERHANLLDGAAPYYRCYRCSDGKFVAVGALEPQFFALLLEGLGLPHDMFVQADRSGWSHMAEIFEAKFAAKSRDEWAEVFALTDACVTPVLSFEEALNHPHNRARGTFVTREGIAQPNAAPRFSATPLGPADEPSEMGRGALANLWAV